MNLSTADIDDQIIAPALWLIGELWERGEITVADEHLATARVQPAGDAVGVAERQGGDGGRPVGVVA